MKWLYNYESNLIGFPFLFVYWDRKAEVLEFNIFDHARYFWIEPEGENAWDIIEKEEVR